MIDINYYENGKIRSILTHNIRGELHGVQVGWYSGGNLRYKSSFKNNMLHGLNKRWISGASKPYCVSYYIYGEMASKEEWREHRLTATLAGVKI